MAAMTRGEEFFVYRTTPEAMELRARFDQAESLYGSAVGVEADGTILIPKWMTVARGTVSADEFTQLSESRYSDEALFRQGLISKDVSEMQIHEVKKNGGSVEAAIRLTENVITDQRDVEQHQVTVVLERTRYLQSLFSQHEISGIPEAAREALQQETIALLMEAGLDPEQVKLGTKRLMALWLIKASKGEDSLERINEMITWQGLEAVERRAVDREVAVSGEIIAKYSQMGAGLTVVRSVDRMILVDVGEEIEQRLLRNEYLFNPRAPIRRDIGYTVGKIGSLCTLLGQTRVRPYRPIAIEARGVLDWTQQLLGANRQEELFELGLPDYLRGLAWGFRNILDNHDDISSENS